MSNSQKAADEADARAEKELLKRLHSDEVAWLKKRHIQAIQNNEEVSTNSHGIPTSKQIDLWKLSSPKEASADVPKEMLLDKFRHDPMTAGSKIEGVVLGGVAELVVTPEMLAAQVRRTLSFKIKSMSDGIEPHAHKYDVAFLSELTSLHGHLMSIKSDKT